MSEILDRNLKRAISEVPVSDLKILIAGFIDDANIILGRVADDRDVAWLIDWTTSYVQEKFNYLPIHHLRAAINSGALGERGGTTKLIPRNINLWLREQAAHYQEHRAKMISHDDAVKRNEYFNANKAEWQVAAAVRIKVGWLGDGMITSDEYDSFSSKEIYDLLKSGVPEKAIHPRDVVPNYEQHRNETI